jgi:hypothetical protein
MGDELLVRVDVRVEGHGYMGVPLAYHEEGHAYTRTERGNVQRRMQDVKE